MDRKQLIRSVIHEEVGIRRRDINKVKNTIRREILECRTGLKLAKEIFRRDIETYKNSIKKVEKNDGEDSAVYNNYLIINPIGYSISKLGTLGPYDIFIALFIVWHFLYFILKASYDWCIFARKYLRQQHTEVSLSPVDHAYIDEEYTACCSEFWLQEVTDFWNLNHRDNLFTENNIAKNIQDILNSLDSIHNLSQISEPFNQLKYYKLLMKNCRKTLIGGDDEKTIIKKFKANCLERIIACSDSFQTESDFLKVFVNFLLASKNTQVIIARLQLEQFCRENLSFNKLIEEILNLEVDACETDVTYLQEVAGTLRKEKKPFLIKTFREVISSYIEPVKVQEKPLDGRLVIEMIGKIIVLSRIIPQIQERLLDPHGAGVEEIRIVGADILHVDMSLDNDVWHGKNIVIIAKKVKIYDKVSWNVSGKDNDHIYPDNAGTGEDGHGVQGKDGHAGESGGNVLIEADEVENPNNFTIISHGGKGSRGQDGGDASEGEDGKGMTRSEFDKKFPSVIKFLSNLSDRRRLFRETVDIIRNSPTIKIDWSENENVFIKAVTDQGIEIIFSHTAATFTRYFQAYLLCKGSLGQQGGRGGEYGLGGQGGYHGEIPPIHSEIAAYAVSGDDGKQGIGGLHGKHGKNAWDMGYTDYQTWAQTQFYGKDESSKLKLQYHDCAWGSAPNDSVWCVHQNKYANITAAQVEHKQARKYEERTDTKQNIELQPQARAAKKKSISRGKMLADYSHCFSSMENGSFRNTQSDLDRIIKHALIAMVENAEQQKKVATELKVKRHVKSTRQEEYMRRKRTVTPSSSNAFVEPITQKPDMVSLIRALTSGEELHNQSHIRSVELDRPQLVEILSHLLDSRKTLFENPSIAGNIGHTTIKNIEQILRDKYRFAVLREIAKQLPGDCNLTENSQVVSAEYAKRYLTMTDQLNDTISHPILGTLNQYLYRNGEDQQEKISRFYEEELQNTENEPLRRSLRRFLLKVVKSDPVNSEILKYYVEYEKFLEAKIHSLNVFLEPLRSELKQHKDIFDLWNRRNNNQSIKLELNRKIGKHAFLNALYRRFNNQLKHSYDWNKCCRDESFLTEYKNHIRVMGPLSESYRELLAHIFDVNIRVYREDQNKQFRWLDNHNPSSERVIHTLCRKNELKQLDIDRNHLKLEMEQSKIGDIYAKVLAKTSELTSTREFDNYLANKTFFNETKNSLRPYAHESSNEWSSAAEFYLDDLQNTGHNTLKQSVKAFILEVSKSERRHPNVEKYCVEFQEFSKKRTTSLNIFFEPFYVELKLHKRAFALWKANKQDKSLQTQLEKEIRKYDFLSGLYKRFDNQLKQDYNWDKCCRDEGFLQEYNCFIREGGSLSQNQGNRSDDDQDDSWTHIFANYEFYKQEDEPGHPSDKLISPMGIIRSDDEYLIVCEEQDIAKIMTYFSCPEERLLIKHRLEKISLQYTGHTGIIQNISQRFSNDGRQVSFQELSCFVNSVLTYVIEGRKNLNIFCWIVAAYSQKNWMDQLVLLQLENYFKASLTERSKWQEYLSQVKNKDILILFRSQLNQYKSSTPISTNCINDILYLLSNIPTELIIVDELDLPEWPYALKEKYWTHKLTQLMKWKESEKLSEASYYLRSMENIFGTFLVEQFVEILEEKDLSPGTLMDILYNFHAEKWLLSDEELELLTRCDIIKWKENMLCKFNPDKKERDVTRLVQQIRGNKNTSERVSEKLLALENVIRRLNNQENTTIVSNMSRIVKWFKGTTVSSVQLSTAAPGIQNPVNQTPRLNNLSDESSETEYSIQEIRDKIRSTDGTTTRNMTENDLITYSQLFRKCIDSYQGCASEKDKFIGESLIGMLGAVNRAIQLKRKFKLRDTQKLAILILLQNKHNTLAQVSTGEGKSLIVVAAAIMKCLCGEKVDIITSSSVLAKRDAEMNRNIYSLFNISVSHNCSEGIEVRKTAYSSSEVVYGDLSNFQRDYLLDRFYEKNILGDRKFENIIVDEVDSMLLDKGNSMLYLSHDLPGLDKLESLYLYIWQRVNRPAGSRQDVSFVFDIEAIKEAVLNDLYDVITKDDIKKLDFEMDEQRSKMIWERLIEVNILDKQGKMLTENINCIDFKTILSPELHEYENRLYYLLKECIERNKYIRVPNYLKSFIVQHLETWINSAIRASVMQEGHDYVVDVDRTGTSQNRDPHIIIVDRDTGTDQASSQWDEALHQFLQLKHGCKLSLQSLKAVFISNVSYLKLYTHLYGLTGTLGSQPERELLKAVHEVDFVTVPTARSKQFQEKLPIFCTDKKKWIQTIIQETTFITGQNRSVLIICDTIDDTETLHTEFVRSGMKNIHTYARDYIEFDIAQGTKELEQGQIIIATNLSGRGTDIKITGELRQAGGLHVIVSYLPNNSRIEQQAFGRVARSGDEGSGRLIVMGVKGQKHSSSKILDLKLFRDAEELHRISYIKAYYETQIVMEESYFNEFRKQFVSLNEQLTAKNLSADIKKILLQSCLDKWAFWLDRNSKRIANVTDEQNQQDLKHSLNEFISQLRLTTESSQSLSTWVDEQPIQMIQLGKYFCQDKEYNAAIELFDKVIESEPHFSEAAHYYKAFALIKKTDWEKKPVDKQAVHDVKTELRKAAKIFTEHSTFSMRAAATISTIKQNTEKSIIQIESYAEQKKIIGNIYYMFSRSISNIFQQPVTPETFVNGFVDEELSEVIYDDLLSNGILKRPKIKNKYSEDALNKISLDYGISTCELDTLLSDFRGVDIIETEFLKTLKMRVKLPSRENFWKLLIQNNILDQEVRYVIIDAEKLKIVDPSLLFLLRSFIVEKKLQQRSLDCRDPNEITLNVEQDAQQIDSTAPQRECIVIEKAALREAINNHHRYIFLKNKGIFSFNKKARVDLNKIVSTNLSSYDSITLEDFSKRNIIENDAELILARLVEQNVLEQDISENGSYRLKVSFNEIAKIQLPVHPVYMNAVKGLLSSCFIYRITLERIKYELERKIVPVYLRLPSKPHRSLFCELMEQDIIRPVKVDRTIKDLNQKLKNIHKQTITRDQLRLMLSESRLIPNETNIDELCNHLIEKRWVVGMINTSPIRTRNDNLNVFLEEITSAFNSGKKYSINDSDDRQELSSHINVQETIKRIFDRKLKLIKGSTLEDIIRILEESKSPLKTLAVPDSSLEPLSECNGLDGYRYLEEVNIFILNGVDQLLRLVEKKWTRTMLWNTAIVVAMGVCQITIGTVIEIYSVGVMTNVASSCISEGISDIIFAANAYRSGNFSWKDYRQHKLQSLMLTVATAGIGTYFSSGAKVSSFGTKIAGNSLDIGEKVAALSGSELINVVGAEAVAKLAGNRIIRKTISAAAFGLAQTGIDVVVQNYLKKLCNDIGSAVMSAVTTEVNKHKVSATLERIYERLGRDSAMKLVNDLTQSLINEPTVVERFIAPAFKIAQAATNGLADGVRKMSQAGKNMYATVGQFLSWVIALLPAAAHLTHVGNISKITGNLLDNVERKLTQELRNNEVQNNYRPDALHQNQRDAQDCERFKTEVIDQWNSMLREQAGRIVEQHIMRPILTEGASHLVRYCESKIKTRCQPSEDVQNNERSNELKRQYQESQSIASASIPDDQTEVENSTVDEYHEKLNTLIAKTSDPKLLAAVARENAPMDVTYLEACARVSSKISKTTGLTILVRGDDGTTQTFSSSVEGVVEERVIELKLINNRFQLHGNQINGESNNNCLYEAMSAHMDLNMTREVFRAEMAKCIESDLDVQYVMRQNWCSFPTSDRAIGDRQEINMSVGQRCGVALNQRVRFSQRSMEDLSISRNSELKRPVGATTENINSRLQGEAFTAEETADGYFFLHNHQSVGAALSSTTTQPIKFMAYEETQDVYSARTMTRHATSVSTIGSVAMQRSQGKLNHVGFLSHAIWSNRSQYESTRVTKQQTQNANFEDYASPHPQQPRMRRWNSTEKF